MSPRLTTLKQIAERSESLADFGRHLHDWLHELRRILSRARAAAVIADEPERLREKFPQGYVADAWLAGCAEHLAGTTALPAPEWSFASWRIAVEPLFDEGSGNPTLRSVALHDTPLAFNRPNIFTPSVDLPLSLRTGRPTKSAKKKRKTTKQLVRKQTKTTETRKG